MKLKEMFNKRVTDEYCILKKGQLMEMIGSRLLRDEQEKDYVEGNTSGGDVIMEVTYDDEDHPEEVNIHVFRVDMVSTWIPLNDPFLEECKKIADTDNEEGTTLYEKYNEEDEK